MRFTIVKKGEKAIMPINHSGFQWVAMVAEQNGIILTIGPGGGFGVFIGEEKLQEIHETFCNAIKKGEENEMVNNCCDTTVCNADTCRCNDGTD